MFGGLQIYGFNNNNSNDGNNVKLSFVQQIKENVFNTTISHISGLSHRDSSNTRNGSSSSIASIATKMKWSSSSNSSLSSSSGNGVPNGRGTNGTAGHPYGSSAAASDRKSTQSVFYTDSTDAQRIKSKVRVVNFTSIFLHIYSQCFFFIVNVNLHNI